jgi:hypothetical protein
MKPDENKKWDELSKEIQDKLGDIFDTYTLRDAIAAIYREGYEDACHEAVQVLK